MPKPDEGRSCKGASGPARLSACDDRPLHQEDSRAASPSKDRGERGFGGTESKKEIPPLTQKHLHAPLSLVPTQA